MMFCHNLKEAESFIYISEAFNKMNEVDYSIYIEMLKTFFYSIDKILVLPKVKLENFALLVFELKKKLADLVINFSDILEEKLKPNLNRIFLKLKESKKLEAELLGQPVHLNAGNVSLIQSKIITIFDALIFPYYKTLKNDMFLDLFVNWLIMLPTDQSNNDFKIVVILSSLIKQILEDKKAIIFNSEKWVEAMLSVIIYIFFSINLLLLDFLSFYRSFEILPYLQSFKAQC